MSKNLKIYDSEVEKQKMIFGQTFGVVEDSKNAIIGKIGNDGKLVTDVDDDKTEDDVKKSEKEAQKEAERLKKEAKKEAKRLKKEAEKEAEKLKENVLNDDAGAGEDGVGE